MMIDNTVNNIFHAVLTIYHNNVREYNNETIIPIVPQDKRITTQIPHNVLLSFTNSRLGHFIAGNVGVKSSTLRMEYQGY